MSEQIYAVLMALEGDTLLLPNSAVNEVVPRDRVRPAGDGAPSWFAGFLEWNNRRVPVVSFETLNGSAVSATRSRRERVAVVNCAGVHLQGGSIGILTQGHPHLVTLNRTAVKPAALRDTDRAELILARVRISSQEAAIPDLDVIEADLSRVIELDVARNS